METAADNGAGENWHHHCEQCNNPFCPGTFFMTGLIATVAYYMYMYELSKATKSQLTMQCWLTMMVLVLVQSHRMIVFIRCLLSEVGSTMSMNGRVCGVLVQFSCYQHRQEWIFLSCSCSHKMMQILFVDDCSQETYLADVLIRCSYSL